MQLIRIAIMEMRSNHVLWLQLKGEKRSRESRKII